ncbi:hypothetical protein GCM10023093_27660 [Nemorincola caseinilytica]|uniref:Glycosyl transferase family 1 domain-containing protein n=1 Tax=Nemorincola caseinilytica TaxID=2054315 RepID=A0ABP8NKZ2_9BACT
MVVERDISPYRENMGWEVPKIEGVTIEVAPSRERIKKIVDTNRDAIHVLSGIKGSKIMNVSMKRGAKRKVRMGSMSEPYDRTGIKGRLRDVKYWYTGLFFYRHFDFLLAIGKEGVNTYTRIGFNAKRVFPWAYFVSVDAPEKQQTADGITKIIYAGRVEKGKGIYPFVTELAKAENKRYRLDIYGSGPDEDKLKEFVQDNALTGNIYFHPFLKYNEMVKQYTNYDWVVLPSTRKDGWGVIINEGLLNGLKAICSNICGVSWAIADKRNGVTFDWRKHGSCSNAIDTMLAGTGFANAADIQEWARRSLSGEAGAAYFLEIMDNVYDKKDKPSPPWLANKI